MISNDLKDIHFLTDNEHDELAQFENISIRQLCQKSTAPRYSQFIIDQRHLNRIKTKVYCILM